MPGDIAIPPENVSENNQELGEMLERSKLKEELEYVHARYFITTKIDFIFFFNSRWKIYSFDIEGFGAQDVKPLINKKTGKKCISKKSGKPIGVQRGGQQYPQKTFQELHIGK